MKALLLSFLSASIIFFSSCASQQGLAGSSSIQEATTLAANMGSKLGLTAIQQTSVYTALYNFYSGKKDLLDKVKNNTLTQAAYSVAEAQLTTVKNNAIKSVMSNSTQLAALAQYFGIQ